MERSREASDAPTAQTARLPPSPQSPEITPRSETDLPAGREGQGLVVKGAGTRTVGDSAYVEAPYSLFKL